MRIVGVDALFSAIELREITEDQSLEEKIIDLFIPQEFTRVDKIISTAFEFAIDQEEAAYKPADQLESDYLSESQSEGTKQSSNNIEAIEEFKVLVAQKMASKFGTSFNRNRSLFDSADVRFAVAVSKRYDRLDKYWFAYHPRHIDFLNDTSEAYFVLGCLDAQKAFAVPVEKMNAIASEMLTTSPKGDESKTYHHVVIREDEDRYYIFAHPTKNELDISQFEI